jgi:protein TonB
MKKMFFSSLFAMLMLVLCQDEMAHAQKKADAQFYEFQKLKNPPTYPGGVEKFYRTVFSNVTYPEAASKKNIQGTVVLSFVIEKNGTIGNISPDKDLGSGLTEAAIVALKSTKKWKPAEIDGKPVRVKMNIPIKFALKS